METKEPKRNGTRVIFGPCRLSYCHLLEKHSAVKGAPEKYSTAILIPKSDTATVKALRDAIEEAKQIGVEKKWNHKVPSKLSVALLDGNDKENSPEYAGHWYINAKSNTKPGVVDRARKPIDDPDQIYGGMWAVVSLSAYPYGEVGNNGVAFGLNNVMKWADGERFGGKPTAESDFDGYDDDLDDDLF